jgi:hypothetical protein
MVEETVRLNPSLLAGNTTTRLHRGGRLRLLRLGWLFTALLVITVFLVTLPQQYALLRDTSMYAGGYAESLQQLRITPAFFAAYFISFDVIGVLIGGVLAFLMFRQTSYDWMAMLVSLTIIFLLVYLGGYVVFALLPAWEMFLGTVNLICVILLAVSFPDGRIIPARVRPLLPVIVCLLILNNFLPPEVQIVTLVVVIVASMAAQIYRYRTVSSPVQRQQTKWALFGLITAGVATLVFQLVPKFLPLLAHPLIADPDLPAQYGVPALLWMFISAAMIHIGITAVPVTIGFSILRFRLWDIDLIIHRSLVFGAVMLVLVPGFLLQFFVAQWALTALLGDAQSGLAVALSAAATTLLFRPAQRRIQRFVDREWYGFRFDLDQLQKAQQDAVIAKPGSLTGQTLGRFTVLERLGAGGMGEVYKARDGETTIAIKTLPVLFALDEQFRLRFEREARLLKTLDHPRIVKVLDSGESGGTYYLAMEYIDGQEVGKRLRQHGAMSVDEARSILRDVADALEYAHGLGLVHRDIKPSNIMLRNPTSNSGRGDSIEAVLMDFGVVKVQDARTDITGTGAIGTIDYMAPEQIIAARTVDKRADIYALGVMLYEMLTGERPFKGSAAQVLFAHVNQPAPDPRLKCDTIPQVVVTAIQRAMSKNPDDRFQSVRELAEAIAPGRVFDTTAA